jgi:hypothetical protein
MFYVIQKNVFRETNYNIIFETLERLGLEFEIVEFDDDGNVDIKTQRKDVFPFGSVRLANISTNQDWYPGSFFGGNHDFSVYSQHYKENLLNYDSKIFKFGDTLEWGYNETKFIRPCKDSKLFTGQVFTKTKWEDMVEMKKQNPHFKLEMLNDLIQVNNPKTIYKEARTWIVDGKVVTSSYYKFGQYIEWVENVEDEGIEFANNMAQSYQVADTFVMDICLTPDGWKIVEINCTNCSGFYKGDMQKLVIALENKFNPIDGTNN